MTGGISALVEEYIVLRRGLGYRPPSQERALRAFARHLDQSGHDGDLRSVSEPTPSFGPSAWATAHADPY